MLAGLEIFSGAGGLAKGLDNAGVKHQAFVEVNKHACNTLRRNFEKNIVHECDIELFNFRDYKNISIIAGGPPCQPFSLGGKHRGHLDKRDMFPYAVKAINNLKPKAFIFENVKGLLRKSFASYFNYIILQLTYPEIEKLYEENWLKHLKRLEEIHTSSVKRPLKYNVIYRLVNSADYGIPQKRERVIIVGIRNDLNIVWSFPKPTHSEERLYWDQFVTKEYWEKHGIPNQSEQLLSPIIAKKVKKVKREHGLFSPPLKPWRTVRDGIGHLPNPKNGGALGNFSDHIFIPGAKTYPGHTGSYIDSLSKTIKAGGHGVPGGENMIRYADGSVRYYTVLEAKLIQTFPEDFKITGAWGEAMRQIGNAVPVKLATLISKSLVKSINENNLLD